MDNKISEFLDFLSEDSKSKSASIANYKKKLRDFSDFFRGREIESLSQDDLNSFLIYVKEQKYSIQTYNLYVSSIKVFYNFLFTRYKIKNLGKEIKNEKKIKKERDDSSILDFLKKIGEIKDTRKTIFLLYGLVGLNLDEISNLKKNDVAIDGNRLILKISDKEQSFYIKNDYLGERLKKELTEANEHSKKYLFETGKGGKLTIPNITYIFNECKKKVASNIKKFSELRSERLLLKKEIEVDPDLESILKKQYSLVKLLYESENNLIYCVHDHTVNKDIALKLLKQTKNDDAIKMFKDEFRVQKTLSHKIIPKVFEFGYCADKNRYYFTMEYFDYDNLSCAKERISFKSAIFILLSILDFLSQSKACKINHYDINPNNILFKSRESQIDIKLIDFGFSLRGGKGAAWGTSFFIAPEILVDQIPQEQSDIYSLGVTIYKLMTGTLPFSTDSFDLFLDDIKNGRVTQISELRQDIPDAFCKIIHRMIEYDPKARYATPSEIVDELTRAFKNEIIFPIKRRSITVNNPSFVGRFDELQNLNHIFEITFSPALKTKENKIILISGESGIGKRRLLSEFETKASLSDITIKRLFLNKNEPLSIVQEFLNKSTLASFFDESLNLDNINKISILKRGAEQFYDEISKKPGIIVVYNAELIKKDLLIFFRFLLLEFDKTKEPYLLIFSFNSSEEQDELTKTIESKLPAYTTFLQINLARLKRDEVSKLLASSLNIPVNNNILDYIYKLSGGNPGYILNILNYLHEKGLIGISDHEAILVREPDEQPQSIRDALDLRVKSLPPLLKKILYIVSSCNFDLTESTLLAILKNANLGITDKELSSHLERLKINNFIAEDEFCSQDSESDITSLHKDISHEHTNGQNKVCKIKAVDESLSDSTAMTLMKGEIRDLHLAMANTIESDPGILEAKEILAHHLVRGGEHERGTHYYLEVANSNFNNFYFEKAKTIYELIISSSATMDMNKREELFNECSIKLGDIGIKLGDFKGALLHFNKIRLASIEPKKQIYVLKRMARLKINHGSFNEAIATLDRALELTDDLESEKIEVKSLMVSALIGLSKYNDGKAIIDELLCWEIENSQKIKLYNQRGLLSFYSCNYNEALSYFKLTLELSEMVKNQNGSLNALSNIGLIYSESMDYEKAFDSFNKALPIADNIREVQGRGQILLNLGNSLYNMGRIAESLAAYTESRRIFDDLDKSRESEIALINIALIHSEMSDYDVATKLLDESSELLAKRENKFALIYNNSIRGDIAFNCGDYNLSLSYYKKAHDSACEISAKIPQAEGMINMASSYAMLDQHSNIDELIAKALLLTDNKITIVVSGSLLKARIFLDSNNFADLKETLNKIEKIDESKLPYNIKISYLETFLKYHYNIGNVDRLKYFGDKLLHLLHRIYQSIPERFYAGFLNNPRIKGAENALALVKMGGEESLSANTLSHLLKINLAISSLSNIDEVFTAIIDGAILLSGAKRGFVLLKRGESFTVKASKNFDKENISAYSHLISKTIFNKTIEQDKFFNIENAFLEFYDSKSISNAKLKSILSFPISVRGEVIGVIYLDDPERVGAFSNVKREYMQAFANQISVAISNFIYVDSINNENKKTNEIIDELEKRLKVAENQVEREQIRKKENGEGYKKIITQSKKMKAIFDLIGRIKDEDLPVLIIGESGVGKELIARAVHFNGARREEPFFAENCGAINENILESELFGYVKGAFTDAHTNRSGILEAAGGGTIFLDEIGEMSLDMQKKFLRVLQEKKIRRVGGNKLIPIHARIIAATNKNLENMVLDGKFREDLYYRINVIKIDIPPLRERKEDIPLLVEYFVNKYKKERRIRIKDSLIKCFNKYDWPGNVRELENEILRLFALIKDDTIDEREYVNDSRFAEMGDKGAKTLAEIERGAIENALKRTGDNQSKAAKALGISLKALKSKIQRWKNQSKYID